MKPGHLSVNMQGRAVSGPLQAMPATMTTNTLTPTTLKTITQIFESDACLDNLHRYEETGGFEPPTVLPGPMQAAAAAATTTVGNTDGAVLSLIPASVESSTPGIAVVTRTSYSNSKRWQGGVATVVSPSQDENPLALPDDVEEEDEADYQEDDIDMDEDYEPEAKRPANSAAAARRSTRTAKGTKASPFSSPVVSSSSTDKKRGRAGKSGRKPAGGRAIDEASLSPAERKRLNVRRERNKQAAARCRNRRLVLTNKLAAEVEVWEGKKQSLTQEIQELTAAKKELEFILEAHRHTCKFSAERGHQPHPTAPVVVAIKSEPVPVTSSVSPVLVEPVNAPYLLEAAPALSGEAAAKMARPSSLPFASAQPKAASPKAEVGVDIETPSVILPNVSFDSLVSTGLTPTTVVFNSIVTPVTASAPMLNTPTCSRQHYAVANKAGDAGGPEYLQL